MGHTLDSGKLPHRRYITLHQLEDISKPSLSNLLKICLQYCRSMCPRRSLRRQDRIFPPQIIAWHLPRKNQRRSSQQSSILLIQHPYQQIHQEKLGKILQRSTSKSLLEMSQQDPENGQNNENFLINLKHKLCLELWPNDETVICACGQQMDIWGDLDFCCKIITKTTMSNETRDGIYRLL